MISIADISYVIVDHDEVYISMDAFKKMSGKNCAYIICDDKHPPNGMLLNLNSLNSHQEIFKHQIKLASHKKTMMATNHKRKIKKLRHSIGKDNR